MPSPDEHFACNDLLRVTYEVFKRTFGLTSNWVQVSRVFQRPILRLEDPSCKDYFCLLLPARDPRWAVEVIVAHGPQGLYTRQWHIYTPQALPALISEVRDWNNRMRQPWKSTLESRCIPGK